MTPRLLAVALLLVLPAGCGGGEAKPAPKRARTAPGVVGPSGEGKLVAIGGGRSLFVNCVGEGSPTVLLEAGLGVNADTWRDVQPEIGRTTRTCAYDRAGLGSSVAPPGIRDAGDDVADAGRLLDALDAGSDVVLVGHSYGGLLARLLVRSREDDIGGVVLIDAMGRDQARRELAIWPRGQAPAVRRSFARRVIGHLDLQASEARARTIRSLGDIPLAVVTAGNHEDVKLPRRLAARLYRLWLTMQDELASLSPDHLHVVARNSNHFVQAADQQPEVVIRAVRAVVDAVRSDAPLPPCPRVFRGAGVRCRAG